MTTTDDYFIVKLSWAFAAFLANQPDKKVMPTTARVLPMDYTFDNKATYRSARFDDSITNGILYRPDIVNEMEAKLPCADQSQGLFVRGPQGVGKSHSVYNFVQKLRSDGHIVTFISDCQSWDDLYYLWEALCQSILCDPDIIGTSPSDVAEFNKAIRHIQKVLMPVYNSYTGEKTQAKIYEALERRRKDQKLPREQRPKEQQHTTQEQKRWFFVFDQINRIFSSEHVAGYGTTDAGLLRWPFKYMDRLNKYDGITCVISASANNEASHVENHENFIDFDHKTEMSEDEFRSWMSAWNYEVKGEDLRHLKHFTGFCPLQVISYLNDTAEYEEKTILEVGRSLDKLLKNLEQHQKNEVQEAAIACVLNLELGNKSYFDRKYSYRSGVLYKPVFPLVSDAYRTYYCNEVLKYIESCEHQILTTCRERDVTDDVRGRLFELLVIQRFRRNTTFDNNKLIPSTVGSGMVFEGQKLPNPKDMTKESLFIPKNSNFPAIDLIIKVGQKVWGVQIHTNPTHDDVLPKFRTMCDAAGWHGRFEEIHLVYLSPSDLTKKNVETKTIVRSKRKVNSSTQQLKKKKNKNAKVSSGMEISPPDGDTALPAATSANGQKIHVSAITVAQVKCLETLKWRDRDMRECK